MIVKTLRTFNPDPVHWLHKTFKFHIAFRDIHSQAPRWNIFHFHFISHKVGRIYTFQHCCARQYRAVAEQGSINWKCQSCRLYTPHKYILISEWTLCLLYWKQILFWHGPIYHQNLLPGPAYNCRRHLRTYFITSSHLAPATSVWVDIIAL